MKQYVLALALACIAAGGAALVGAQARAQVPAGTFGAMRDATQQQDEAAAAAVFERVSGNAARLRLFLQAFPKGGDLHNHLGGSVYAEDFLLAAAEQGLCADEEVTQLVRPPCAPGREVAAMASDDPFAYARLVDALSTRGYQAGTGPSLVSGHAQFFSSFGNFGPAFGGNSGRWLAEARASAARNQVVYLELMHNPEVLSRWFATSARDEIDAGTLAAAYRRDLPAVEALMAQAVAEVDAAEGDARTRLSCGTAEAQQGCDVAVRYLFSGMRGMSPAQVWRSLLAGFALSARDPRFVGVNIVMPEDDPVALRDYRLHMAMFRFLADRFPGVKTTMHAGELTLGLVRPADLEDHIEQAVAAGARRIGHGVGIAYESRATETLARMAREGIAAEINLTSNAVILGVEAGRHPVSLYRAAGVPVVLSTDDEGVLRSDLTNEYQRAVTQQGFAYADLKAASRASLEYAFVPGASLWRDRQLGAAVAPCAASFADTACMRFLEGSEKAKLQARLEQRFDQFERSVGRFDDRNRAKTAS